MPLLSMLPVLAAAQPEAPAISPGDTAWVLISTALVLLMVPGLAFSMAVWSVPRARSTPCS